jgi:protein-disulfide isomerase
MTIVLVLVFLVMASWISLPTVAGAAVELKILRSLDLKATPLDVASSTDGQRLFILTPGEILIYSIQDGKIVDRFSVDKGFDRIASLPRPDALTISSSTNKSLQVILLESIYKIDVSGLPFKGPRDAPVTIAIFDDYQWPYCAGLEPLLQQVLEKFPKEVKLVIKQYPLPMHSYARKAAVAALAADKQGKFWEMHHELFANQRGLSDAKVDAIAQQLGLKMDQFHQDLKDPTIASLIDRDMTSAAQANVQGTPAIFVNGRLLNQRSLPGFQQAIEAELKRGK